MRTDPGLARGHGTLITPGLLDGLGASRGAELGVAQRGCSSRCGGRTTVAGGRLDLGGGHFSCPDPRNTTRRALPSGPYQAGRAWRPNSPSSSCGAGAAGRRAGVEGQRTIRPRPSRHRPRRARVPRPCADRARGLRRMRRRVDRRRPGRTRGTAGLRRRTMPLPRFERGVGSFTRAATFLVIRSSVTAWDRADRRAPRMSLTVRADGVSEQQVPICAAPSLRWFPGRILALGAALAGLANPVEPGLYVAYLEPVEPLGAVSGHDVEPDERLVRGVGRRRQVGLDDIGEP